MTNMKTSIDLNDLAQRIHDFLLNYDPAFGYAENVIGQQNEQEWVHTIYTGLSEGETTWFLTTVSELVVSVPESEADGDDILGDIFLLQSVA